MAKNDFKNVAAVYKGKPVTVVRMANKGDGADVNLNAPHFLIVDEDGNNAVVPATDVTPAAFKD